MADFKLAVESREASLNGSQRGFPQPRQVWHFGDGKEVAQIAMARFSVMATGARVLPRPDVHDGDWLTHHAAILRTALCAY